LLQDWPPRSRGMPPNLPPKPPVAQLTRWYRPTLWHATPRSTLLF
jgi:hypothetical protein